MSQDVFGTTGEQRTRVVDLIEGPVMFLYDGGICLGMNVGSVMRSKSVVDTYDTTWRLPISRVLDVQYNITGLLG